MLGCGMDKIVIVYVPRACIKKNFESVPPRILVLVHIFLFFGHFEPLQALFEPPDPGPGYVKLGPDQIVIVYVPRACSKKILESNPPIILVLGYILLVFGHFEPL